jgi:hypothetical protein
MNVSEDVFVREVDEELQKDQMQNAWNRYGKPAVAMVAAGLLGWAGWLFWEHRQDEAAGLVGEKLTAAVDTLAAGSDSGVSAKLVEVTASTAEGFHGPAGLTAGSLALQQGDVKAAVENFGRIASSQSSAQVWRDLALIRQTAASFDTLKPDEIVARLKPLAVPGAPWYGSAGEMTAMAYIKMNKPEMAGKMLAELAKDEGVPETIRNRASEKANALGVASTRLEAKPVSEGAAQ